MFKVYVEANRVLDDWNNGEIGHYQNVLFHDCYGSGKTIEAALDNTFDNILYGAEWRQNLSLMNDDPECKTLIYSRNEKEDGTSLHNQEDIEAWKIGKLRSYAVYYTFNIIEEKTVEYAELKKLDLATV